MAEPLAQPQAGAGPTGSASGRPAPSDQDKALSKALQKEIDGALEDRKDDFKRFRDNRLMLRGYLPNGGEPKKVRTNLWYANLAALRPQVYAKDPEFSVMPTRGVPAEQVDAMRAFGEAGEALLDSYFVQDCRLKQRSKRILTSAYTNAIGWWKLAWQQGRPADPVIANRLKDSQDNLAKMQRERAEAQEPGTDHDTKIAELEQTIAGMQSEAEKRVGRGLVLDFVMPDDLVILDKSIFEVQDYMRAGKLAQRVWMTRDQYEAEFGYDPEKATVFRDKTQGGSQGQAQGVNTGDRGGQLLAVFEVWDQTSNRVHTLCMGEEGFCRPSYSPDWTGRRWFPFFLLLWNEVDGAFLPPSDVELTAEVVKEYNDARCDLEQDRRDARPFTLYRKGGSLTPSDVDNIRNRKGNDLIGVEGVTGKPVQDDIAAITLGTINPNVYSTDPARSDMEMMVGGGDAARGSVLKAKTATEAEIIAQGMRGRSAERTDIIEDLLSEAGGYALEIMLRKLSREEVARVAGPKGAASWPTMTAEEVFSMVHVRVRGGSTGKPDRLQEQDRWTKLMPSIQGAVKEIVAARQAGQEQLAQLTLALIKETLRRFDERFEVERYLPELKEGEEGTPGEAQPEIPPEVIQQVQEQMEALAQRAEAAEQKLKDREADILAGVEKARADAAAKVEVARVTAPIQAQADVEAARIQAEAKAQAQMHAQALQAEEAAAVRANEEVVNGELTAIAGQVAELQEFQQQVAAVLAQIKQASHKPRMKVQHVTGPDGAIVESRLVPDEEGVAS